MTFKYFLVAALIGFSFYLLSLPSIGYFRKGVIFTFVAVMLTFAIQPDWSTDIAKIVGISRGVDLLFYVSHLTLFFIAFLYFLKLKKMELRVTKLVRQLALEPGRAGLHHGSPAWNAEPTIDGLSRGAGLGGSP